MLYIVFSFNFLNRVHSNKNKNAFFCPQSPSFKFSRKASSSYSLKLDPPSKSNKIKTKRKPLSTPASPNRSREPQCTCMTPEQYARLRAQQDPRFRGKRSFRCEICRQFLDLYQHSSVEFRVK